MRVSKTSVKVERIGGEHSPRSASRGACREIQHTFRGHEPLKMAILVISVLYKCLEQW